jgi:hypothetical protein
MKNGYKLGLTSLVASITLVGCGGGSNSTPETVTGQFVDTYVAGLNYECESGATGVTNNLGEYTCNVGDTVTFSVGAYVIGSTTASEGIVTPETLYPEDEVAALNVAQLLQTLDDGSSEGIIVIPDGFNALDDLNTTPDDDINFEDDVELALEDTLVDEDTAAAHLQETELMLLLSGKTFYIVGSDYVDDLVINTDVTSATWTTIIGEIGDTGTDTLEIMTTEGSLITKLKVIPGEQGEDPFHLVLNEELSTDDYLLFDMDESEEQIRFYFEQADAEAYFEGYILVTEEMLSGKTFYDVEEEYDDWQNPETVTGYLYASMTFSNGTFTRAELWVNATDPLDTESWNFDLPYELIGGKIRIDASTVPDPDPEAQEGYIWLTLISESSDEWNLLKEDDADKDGTIDVDSSGTATWLLSEPVDFPDSL